MKIIINKKERQFDELSLSIKELLHKMGFNFPMIVVKVNGTLVKKENYETVQIKDGDNVEAIHLISGG